MTMAPIPSLDQLAADPGKASALPLDAAEKLLAQVHVVQGALLARLVAARAQGNGQPEAPVEDRLLTPEEAAQRLGVTRLWLYRHHRRLSFARKLSRKCLRFSQAGLHKWQAAKRGLT